MASETQTAPLPEPKFSRYRSVKKALARDTLPLPLAPLSMPTPSPRLNPTSQSFSRYRTTRSGKLPPTSSSNLVLEPVLGHGIEQAPSPKGYDSRPIASTRQTFPSGKHTVSLATKGAHELPRSPDADCSNPATPPVPTLQRNNHSRHMYTKPLDTPSDSTAESPQRTGGWESRQQGHEGTARHEGRQLPPSETQQIPRQDSLCRKDAGITFQKSLGTLGGDMKRVKKLEIQEGEKHKRSGPKRGVVRSTSSSPNNIPESETRMLPSLDCDRHPPAMSDGRAKKGEAPNRSISSPVHLELGGGRVVSGLDAPLSAVNAGERVSSIPQKFLIWR